MLYPLLAIIFFVSVALLASLPILIILKKTSFKVWLFYSIWFVAYALFILFGTGPTQTTYLTNETSPYKLPWKAGISRFVMQGNRSFTSHRGSHFHAWDFEMPVGTEVLASREGTVLEIEDTFDGVGLKSNFILIRHADGTIANYAHIKKGGSLVRIGDAVQQGSKIALSGMVGQTIYPHLHFVVLSGDRASSAPITFSEVPGGVPLAGRWYTSANQLR